MWYVMQYFLEFHSNMTTNRIVDFPIVVLTKTFDWDNLINLLVYHISNCCRKHRYTHVLAISFFLFLTLLDDIEVFRTKLHSPLRNTMGFIKYHVFKTMVI